MADNQVQRKLAAILAADVAGYSRLMGVDEAGTRARFKEHLSELIEPAVANRQGRIVKQLGDGLLIDFASVVDAVQCAVEIQEGMAQRNTGEPADRRIDFRIGVNVGDIIVEDDDIHGDGVNVAARLEALAEPGSICISRAARDQIRDKLSYDLADLGEVEVKNIARPIRVFRLRTDAEDVGKISKPQLLNLKTVLGGALILFLVVAGAAVLWLQPWRTDVEAASIDKMAYPLPDRPSIAVLPFTNLSEDKEQDYFADGIVEDIITDISKISGLFVVARDSTFTYKGKPVSIRQISEEFGVRYVLGGSVRRAGNQLRINVQLTDAVRGVHLWADRYDRETKDVFAIQSEITGRVVKMLSVTLKATEHERLYQKYVTNIDAYDAFLQARRTVSPPSKKNIELGEKLFAKAIELDPKFAGGYAGLSYNYSVKSRLQMGVSPQADANKSLELARKAIEVDRNFAWSYIAMAGAHLAAGDHDAAIDAARQALQIQPNGYEENLFMGFYLYFGGQSEEAVRHLETARRLSPVDSTRSLAFLANAYFMNGQYEKSEVLRKARISKFRVGNPNPYLWLAATQVMLGKKDEAAMTAKTLLRSFPHFRLSQWRFFEIFKSEENRNRLYSAALEAGLPE